METQGEEAICIQLHLKIVKKKTGLKPSPIGTQSRAIATNLTLWLQRNDIGNMAIFFRSFHSLKEKQFPKMY